MGSAGRSRSTASGSRRHKVQKQAVRGRFETRHIDLVFSDIVQDPKDVHDASHGPMGNVSKCVTLSCLCILVRAARARQPLSANNRPPSWPQYKPP
jgi:hypothetical protein